MPGAVSYTHLDVYKRQLQANVAALEAGWTYGENTEVFGVRYEVAPATMEAGVYRNITGNTATAYGLVMGAHRAGLQLVLGSYPITPATDILHALSQLKRYNVMTCLLYTSRCV